MVVECGVSLAGAVAAHSPALLAFGSDSFVELLSAVIVLLQFLPSFPLNKRRAAQTTGVLLFLLAAVVAVSAALSLVCSVHPETSFAGIGITAVALIGMPILARKKRAVARATNNRALAADAVQSATCAYLAAVTLLGLAFNAVFHLGSIPVRHWQPYRYSSSRDAELCEVRVVAAAEPTGGGFLYLARWEVRSLPDGEQPRWIRVAGSTSSVAGQSV
jgi:hypothetical protein